MGPDYILGLGHPGDLHFQKIDILNRAARIVVPQVKFQAPLLMAVFDLKIEF